MLARSLLTQQVCCGLHALLTLVLLVPSSHAKPEFPPGSWYAGPQALIGEPLPLGPPVLRLGAELDADSPFAEMWPGKNLSSFTEFIELRMRFVQDDEVFDRFRSAIDTDGYRTGNDGFYTRLDDDSSQMLGLMNSSDVGKALLEWRMPRIAERIDGVGSPKRFQFGHYTPAMSSDLFNMLFKLMWIIESLHEFMPLPGQGELPTAESLRGSTLPFDEWHIVEVGAGAGLHAATAVAAMGAKTYTIMDMPTQQRMQYKVLGKIFGRETVDQTFAFAPCSRKVTTAYLLPRYDLFISTYALSELTENQRESYFWAFIIRSKRGFVIDNHEDIHETRKGQRSDSGAFAGLDLVWRLQDFGFDAKIKTKHEALGVTLHRSRTVIITWAWTELAEVILAQNGIDGFGPAAGVQFMMDSMQTV